MLASRRRSRVSDINQPAGADLDEEPTFRFRMPGSRDPSLLFPQQEGDGTAEEEEDEQEAADDEGVAEDEDAADEEDTADAMEEAADALPAAGEEEEEDYETEPDADQDVEIEEDGQTLESQLRQGSIPRSLSPSSRQKKQTTARRKSLKVSRYGTPYPSLPSSVTKRLATSFARLHSGPTTKLSKDTLDAISQASDWFFEQIGEDLASYAEHAGRKTIEEADVVTLMNRYVVSMGFYVTI